MNISFEDHCLCFKWVRNETWTEEMYIYMKKEWIWPELWQILHDAPLFQLTGLSFKSTNDEAIFGFGEHRNNALNRKGLSFDMEQCLEYGHSHGGEVCLPFIVGRLGTENEQASSGSLDYGFLWNMPGYGSVSFGDNATTWTAVQTQQIDYFVTVRSAGSTGAKANADLLSHYVDATGHALMLPEWAAGYWHSRNRYDMIVQHRNAESNWLLYLACLLSMLILQLLCMVYHCSYSSRSSS